MYDLYIKIGATFATYAAVTSLVIKASKHLEESASEEAKKSTFNWLTSLSYTSAIIKVAESFIYAFDTIFGKKHFTWKCFLRSSLFSALATVIFAILWVVCDLNAAASLVKIEFNSFSLVSLGILVLPIVLNVIPDYISLLETRYILSLVKKGVKSRDDYLHRIGHLLCCLSWLVYFELNTQAPTTMS